MIIIEFKEFFSKIYKFKKPSFNTASFLEKMLNGLGNFDFGQDYYKSLASGVRDITKLQPKVNDPFDNDTAMLNFKRILNTLKIEEILREFEITATHKDQEKIFIVSLVAKLREYIAPVELEEHELKYYFNKYLDNNFYTKQFDIPTLDTQYIMEVNKKCPLCGEQLIEPIDDVNYKNYDIIKIYPDNLTSDEKVVFDSIQPLKGKSDGYSNKIAICKKDAREYMEAKDSKTYEKLVRIKERITIRTKEEKAVENVDVPKMINDIINHLIQHPVSSNMEQLSTDALKISQKIPVTDPYYDTIVLYTSKYYNYINSLLKTHEKKSNNGATKLGEQIKAMSTNLMNLGSTPATIIELIAKHLNDKYCGDDNSLIVCKFIVAYFIQHCEVLSK